MTHTRKKLDKRDGKLAFAKVDTMRLAVAVTVAEETMDASCSKKPNETAADAKHTRAKGRTARVAPLGVQMAGAVAAATFILQIQRHPCPLNLHLSLPR